MAPGVCAVLAGAPPPKLQAWVTASPSGSTHEAPKLTRPPATMVTSAGGASILPSGGWLFGGFVTGELPPQAAKSSAARAGEIDCTRQGRGREGQGDGQA